MFGRSRLWGAISSPADSNETESLFTWDLVVPIPATLENGGSRHRPPVEALRFGHRRASSRFRRCPPGASAGAGADGPTSHAIRHEDAGEAVNAPDEGSTRQGNAPRRAEAWAERRARMRAFLNKGRGYKAWLEGAEGRSTKHLAEREGCSRPRICQLLVLTRLAPEIQADLDNEARTTPVPTERELRAIADLPAVEQVWKYMELTGELVEVRDSRKVARLAGFQHLFARARTLRERYDSGQYRNLDELGATEGITGGRASQLMNLLLLAPDIIAALDVPKERAPRLSERELRRIARLFEHEEQLAVFERMVAAVAGGGQSPRPMC